MRVKIDEIAIKKVNLLKNRVQISLFLQTIYYLCEHEYNFINNGE